MGDWRERISIDPAVCHGKACIAGMGVLVSVVLDNLAEGLTPEEIATEYRPISADDVGAALGYAAALAREEDMVPLR